MTEFRPYVGVNGMAYAREIEAIDTAPVVLDLAALGYDVVAGVQTTDKTQGADIAGKRGPHWYPVGGDAIARTFGHAPKNMCTAVHINHGSKNADDVYLLTKHVLDRCRTTQSIQLNNLNWVHESSSYLDTLRRLRANGYNTPRVILQLSGWLLDLVQPREAAAAARRFGDTVTHTLLDASGGEGIALSSGRLKPFLSELYEKGVAAGIAGGLGPDTIDLASDLLDTFPGLSLDAEGNLRDWPHGRQKPNTSRFSVQRATAFLQVSAHAIKQARVSQQPHEV